MKYFSKLIILFAFTKFIISYEQINSCVPELVKGECSQYYDYTSSTGLLQVDPLIYLFDDLVNIPCSYYLNFLLCSVYKPPCLETNGKHFVIGKPCKILCEYVYTMCYPYMKLTNNKWPDDLNCTNFLSIENRSECLYGKSMKKNNDLKTFQISPLQSNSIKDSKYICFYSNSNYKCVKRCESNIWFNEIEKSFSIGLITTGSSICFLLCLISIYLLIKSNNLIIYPEYCLIYLTISYAIQSFVYLVSIRIDKRLISCQDIKINEQTVDISSASKTPIKTILISLIQSEQNIFCAIIFMTLNYSRLSIITWWFIMVFLLFLINFKYFNLLMKKFKLTKILYLIAWLFPAFHTIFAKSFADVSELTGLCTIGNHNSTALFKFILLPISVILLLGILFTGLNFFKMLMKKKLDSPVLMPGWCMNDIKMEHLSTANYSKIMNNLDKKQFDLTIFAFLFVIPLIITNFCEFYEYLNMSLWPNLNIMFQIEYPLSFREHIIHNSDLIAKNLNDKNKPNFIIFIIKYLMTFLSGFSICLYAYSQNDCIKDTLKRLFK